MASRGTTKSPAPRKAPAKVSSGRKQTEPAARLAGTRRNPAAISEIDRPPTSLDLGTDLGPGQLGRVIANHVRDLRQEIGLNVGQLAERAGMSKGMLSKIENAQTSPSLSTLERLAAALDVPVTSLFRGLAEERDAMFVKAGTGPEIVRRGTRAGHTYELLGSLRGPVKRFEPLLVSLNERNEVFPLFQHAGVEMLYMLEGVMEYGYGKQRYLMEPGDTLQFEGDIPHGPIVLATLPIRFLSITIF